MTGQIHNISEENLEFLRELDKRLHYIQKFHIRLTGEVEVDSYHRDRKMTNKEADRVLDLVMRSRDLVLYPVNTNSGFSAGCAVTQITMPFPGAEDFDTKLIFIRDQLPQGYGWQNLEAVFNSRENIGRIQAAGLGDRLNGFSDNGFETEGYYEY